MVIKIHFIDQNDLFYLPFSIEIEKLKYKDKLMMPFFFFVKFNYPEKINQ